MREETEQHFGTYKTEENFNITGKHSTETQKAAFFLNHLSVIASTIA